MSSLSKSNLKNIKERVSEAIRYKSQILESISEYEKIICELKDDSEKLVKEIKLNHILLFKEGDIMEIQSSKESFLSLEKNSLQMKCKALDCAKEILEINIVKYLSSLFSVRCVIDGSYQDVNVILNNQLSIIKTYDQTILEGIKSKNDLLKEDVSRFEEEKKQLFEQVCHYEEMWKYLDPSMTEVDTRIKVKHDVVKSNRNVRNKLAILDYKRRSNFLT